MKTQIRICNDLDPIVKVKRGEGSEGYGNTGCGIFKREIQN